MKSQEDKTIQEICSDGEMWYYQMQKSKDGPIVVVGKHKESEMKIVPLFTIDYGFVAPLQVLIAIDSYKQGWMGCIRSASEKFFLQ